MPEKKYLGAQQAPSGRWAATLFAGRRFHHVGTWPTVREAAVARDRVALFLGSNVPLNFPNSSRKKGPASPADLRREGKAAVLKSLGVKRAPKKAITRPRADGSYLGVRPQASGTFLAVGRTPRAWSAGCWPTAEKAGMARDRAVLFFGTGQRLNFPGLASRAGPASPLALRGSTDSVNPVRAAKVHLSDADVRALRQRAARGESRLELAAAFSVCHSHVGRLILGNARKAAGGPLRRKQVPKLTDRQIVQLRRAVYRGEKGIDVARRYNISHAWVSQLAHGFARKDAGGPITTDYTRRR